MLRRCEPILSAALQAVFVVAHGDALVVYVVVEIPVYGAALLSRSASRVTALVAIFVMSFDVIQTFLRVVLVLTLLLSIFLDRPRLALV